MLGRSKRSLRARGTFLRLLPVSVDLWSCPIALAWMSHPWRASGPCKVTAFRPWGGVCESRTIKPPLSPSRAVFSPLISTAAPPPPCSSLGRCMDPHLPLSPRRDQPKYAHVQGGSTRPKVSTTRRCASRVSLLLEPCIRMSPLPCLRIWPRTRASVHPVHHPEV